MGAPFSVRPTLTQIDGEVFLMLDEDMLQGVMSGLGNECMAGLWSGAGPLTLPHPSPVARRSRCDKPPSPAAPPKSGTARSRPDTIGLLSHASTWLRQVSRLVDVFGFSRWLMRAAALLSTPL